MRIVGSQFGRVWSNLLHSLILEGEVVKPRGMGTREIQNVQLVLTDARACILVNPARKPNYRFMVAEWLWIWYGRDDVATISKFNRAISYYSDDGISFNGAYGKAIMPAWPYMIQTLKKDPFSRQSVLAIYKQPKDHTKDVPCTISLQFLIRDNTLHATVNMRSSDVWLGMPYDMFNFAMLMNIASSQLGTDIGSITFNLASSHLYDKNYDGAMNALQSDSKTVYSHKTGGPAPAGLERVLTSVPLSNAEMPKDLESPWDCYAEILNSLFPFECFPLLGHLMK